MGNYVKTDWVEGGAPGISATRLKNIEDTIDSERKFPKAGGTATVITLTAYHFSLDDGAAVTFIAAASNNGSATSININVLGAKSLYKPGGTAAPTLIAGKAYTVWYSLTNDCFFIKASATGTATTAQVLADVPFSNESDTDLVGAMPDRSGDTAALSSVTSGTTLKLLASDGYRDGINDYVTHTDANRIASNIRSGVTLDNIIGTLVEGKKWASGNTTVNGTLTVSGLSFTPHYIIAEATAGVYIWRASYYTGTYNSYQNTFLTQFSTAGGTYLASTTWSINSSGFSVAITGTTDPAPCHWIAFE